SHSPPPTHISTLSLHDALPIYPKVTIPVSGIGGIATWTDAAEFIALGSGTVQVCTAAMHYGFRIVEDLADGLSNWMDEQGFARLDRKSTRLNSSHLGISYAVFC